MAVVTGYPLGGGGTGGGYKLGYPIGGAVAGGGGDPPVLDPPGTPISSIPTTALLWPRRRVRMEDLILSMEPDGYWPLDGSLRGFPSASAFGGAAAYAEVLPLGKVADLSGEGLTVAGFNPFDATTAVTFFAYLKLNGSSGYDALFGQYPFGDNIDFDLQFAFGGFQILDPADGSQLYGYSFDTTTDFIALAVVMDEAAGTVRTYVDGVNEDVAEVALDFGLAVRDDFHIFHDNSEVFNGKVAHPAVWKRALDADEIATLVAPTPPSDGLLFP